MAFQGEDLFLGRGKNQRKLSLSFIMKCAFLDCFSGISGDMLLGAFLDLGWDEGELLSLPEVLGLKDIKITICQERRHSISARRVTIESPKKGVRRNLSDIINLINCSQLPEKVIKGALRCFNLLANAEARVHGITPDEVHFHEVGADDAILDITGTFLALNSLKVERIICSPLPLSRGFVRCDHGRLPLPAPAVLEILREKPVYFKDGESELVTPTGAALCVSIAHEWGRPGDLILSRCGYGAGKRDIKDTPNLLRIILFDAPYKRKDSILELRAVIDDMTPEDMGALFELFLENGVIDCWISQIVMKKNRPGFELVCLCEEKKRPMIESLFLSKTSTIGLRIFEAKRSILERKIVEVETIWGKIKAKEIKRPDGNVEVVPEFECCKRIAKEMGLSIRTVFNEAYRWKG